MIKFLRFYLPALLFLLSVHISASAQNCTVNAGADRTICPGQPFTLIGDASGLFNQQATWTQVAGPAVTVSSTTVSSGTATAVVTGYSAGVKYTFRLSAKCTDGSPIFDEANYTGSTLTIANAGPAIVSCPGTVSMAANTPNAAAGETGSWSVVSGNLPVPNPATSPTGTVALPTTGNAVGVTTFRWTITGSTGSCSSTADVTVNNLGGESPVTTVTPLNVGCYSVTGSTTIRGSFAGLGNGQMGTWTFISGPNTPTIGDIHGYVTSLTNLIAGNYKLRWTVAGRCVNGTADLDVHVDTPSQDVTSAGGEPFITFCDARTNTVLNGVVPLYRNEVVAWTQPSTNPAGVAIGNPTSPTTSITGLSGHDDYDFIYTITNTVTNCQSVGIYHVRYTTPPSIIISNPKPSILACNANSLTVDFSVSGGNRSQWALVSGPAGSNIQASFGINNFTTATDDHQLLVGLDKIGTYVFRFRRYSDVASGGCTDSFDDLSVVISRAPYQANAGTSQLLACNVNSTSLAGNGPTAGDSGIGSWTQVSGPNRANIADKNFNKTQVTGLISGVYVFRWIVTGGNTDCGDSQSDVKVVVASVPTTVNAGADVAACYGSPFKLDGNVPALNEVGTWTLLSETPTANSTITFSDTHNPKAVVTGLLANKTYTFRWTISNACGAISDDVAIKTNATNGPKQAAAGADQCVTSGNSFTLQGNAPASDEVGVWTLLPGSPNTPAYTNASTQTVNGATTGTYTFEWKLDRGGCITTRDTVVITISSATTVAQIGGSATPATVNQCGLQPITLTGNTALAPGETGTWTQTGGAGGAIIASPNAASTTVSGLAEGHYKFRYTITNGGCASTFAEVVYNFGVPPTTSAAGPAQALCDATATTLAANTPTVGTGLWIVMSGPGSPAFSTLSDPHATISGLALGTYVLTWRITNGTICPPSESQVTIKVMQSAHAGDDQPLCNVTSTVLQGNTNSDGTWTFLSASPAGTPVPTITNNKSPSNFGNAAVVTNLVPNATYNFRYTIGNGQVGGVDQGGCAGTPSSDDMVVTVSGPPTPADAGADQSFCTSSGITSVTLNANVPTVGTGEWSIASQPVNSVATFSSTTANNATLDNLTAPGTYLLQWSISNANCTGNQSSSDLVRIIVDGPPTVAGPMPAQPNACRSSVILTGTQPEVGTGLWSQVSGPSTAVFDTPNTEVTAVSGLIVSPTPYVFRWTITSGSCGSSSADVSVTVVDETPQPADAGTVADNCTTASSVTLNATPVNSPSVGRWSVTAKPAGAADPTFTATDPHTQVTGLVAGAYTFTWTIGNNSACTSTSDVSFTMFDPPSAANAGPAVQNYCLFAPVVLQATAPAIGTGVWTVVSKPSGAGDPVFSSVTDPNATVNGMVSGSYQFTWTVSNGPCTPPKTATITVSIQDCQIAVAKEAPTTPVMQADGSFDVTFKFHVQNTGTASLNNIQVTDDLISTTFPAPKTYTIKSLTVQAGSHLAVNSSYNGNSDQNLLTAAASSLPASANETITLVVNVKLK